MKRSLATPNCPDPKQQKGIMLLEAMVAILIFSMGLLAVAGLQAAAAANVADTKFRSEASLLADSIIAQMHTDSKDNASMQAKFSSPSGTVYTAWKAQVQDAATGLPGASLSGNTPTIVIAGDNTVTVSVFWQPRAEAEVHSHIVVTQIR